MNVFVSRISHNNSWIWPISAMCLVLGFMTMMARVTGVSRDSRKSYIQNNDMGDRVTFGSIDSQERISNLSSEVTKLQAEKTRLENALANQNSTATVLNENLQDLKLFAGLSEIEGPGILVTLRDSAHPTNGSDDTIHDIDILKVTNVLWAAGADAISVNNVRVVAGTFFTCVEPVVMVNGEPISSPVYIRAIGNPETMMGALNLHRGVLDEIRMTDPNMVKIETVKQMRLPAYNGPTTRKHGAAPREKK